MICKKIKFRRGLSGPFRHDFFMVFCHEIVLHWSCFPNFSFGRIPTGLSLLSHANLRHLVKGWIVHSTTLKRVHLYWTSELFYPSWNRLCVFTNYRLSLALWPTARHRPDMVKMNIYEATYLHFTLHLYDYYKTWLFIASNIQSCT